MLAHKVDGQHPHSYSDLLLTAQKWARQAESRDPLLPNTTTAGVSNVSQSQTPGNLFSSRKLKSNHSFTACSTIVESPKAEEDLNVKPEREEEAESLAEEDAETSSGVGRVDQPV